MHLALVHPIATAELLIHNLVDAVAPRTEIRVCGSRRSETDRHFSHRGFGALYGFRRERPKRHLDKQYFRGTDDSTDGAYPNSMELFFAAIASS